MSVNREFVMSWANTWIGVAGGGFGASAIVGGSYYFLPLYNMAFEQQSVHVAVFGRRLGMTLQAEAGMAFCIMTGVPSGDRFERMESSGVDWGLGAGFNVSATVRSGSVALSALAETVIEAGPWAIEETAKNVVRGLTGDVTPDSNTQNFILLPTPASISIGAGLWYEWSDVLKLGHNLIWQREPPQWGLETRGANVILRMDRIPLQDGSLIRVGLPVDMFGSDDSLVWDTNGTRTARLIGTVYGTKLYPPGTTSAQGMGPDGINLSNLNMSGRNEVNLFSVGRNTEVVHNGTMSIGVSVTSGAVELWASDDYCEVRTDAAGRITRRLGHGGWRD